MIVFSINTISNSIIRTEIVRNISYFIFKWLYYLHHTLSYYDMRNVEDINEKDFNDPVMALVVLIYYIRQLHSFIIKIMLWWTSDNRYSTYTNIYRETSLEKDESEKAQ